MSQTHLIECPSCGGEGGVGHLAGDYERETGAPTGTWETCPECGGKGGIPIQAPVEELTAIGPQYVIPGCEVQPDDGPSQLNLFGRAIRP